MAAFSTDLDKVKLLVVGDSGVGKSSLVHLICNDEAIHNPSWTVGCSVDVKLHEYREGTPDERTFFIEFWDVGGSNSYRNCRCMFYSLVHGIILVHDLTNRKSHQNLRKWLAEILRGSAQCEFNTDEEDYDTEQFAGSSQIPIMVIGTKADLLADASASDHRPVSKVSSIAEDCLADEIHLDCHNPKYLAAGSSNSVRLSRFFNRVIQRHYYSKPVSLTKATLQFDRKSPQQQRPYSPASRHKVLHAD